VPVLTSGICLTKNEYVKEFKLSSNLESLDIDLICLLKLLSYSGYIFIEFLYDIGSLFLK